jgi:chorismate mutase
LRRPKIGDDTPRVTLDELRKQIDKLDDQLLDLLKDRMNISEAIGKYKHENNITILQTRRYDEIMNNRRERGNQRGLDDEFITRIFESIHEESISRHSEIMNNAVSKKEK